MSNVIQAIASNRATDAQARMNGLLRDYLNHMTHPVDRASECYSQEIMA